MSELGPQGLPTPAPEQQETPELGVNSTNSALQTESTAAVESSVDPNLQALFNLIYKKVMGLDHTGSIDKPSLLKMLTATSLFLGSSFSEFYNGSFGTDEQMESEYKSLRADFIKIKNLLLAYAKAHENNMTETEVEEVSKSLQSVQKYLKRLSNRKASRKRFNKRADKLMEKFKNLN